jgi:hypothetical protein
MPWASISIGQAVALTTGKGQARVHRADLVGRPHHAGPAQPAAGRRPTRPPPRAASVWSRRDPGTSSHPLSGFPRERRSTSSVTTPSPGIDRLLVRPPAASHRHVSTYGAFVSHCLPSRRARVDAALAPTGSAPPRLDRPVPQSGCGSSGRNRSTANGAEAPTSGSSSPTNGRRANNSAATLAELIIETVRYFLSRIYAKSAPPSTFQLLAGPPPRGPTSGRTGSAIEPRTRYHTDTTELQWEYISDAVTKLIVDDADYAKSDGSRHSSIASHRSAGPGPLDPPHQDR